LDLRVRPDWQGRRAESQPVSRVLSRTAIPLGRTSPHASSGLPGSTRGRALRPLSRSRLPYLALLQVGFAVPSSVTTDAVRSYRTVSPLPAPLPALRRFAFCCTFRGLAPPRCYLAPSPAEARTFLHASNDTQRPSSRLSALITILCNDERLNLQLLDLRSTRMRSASS